MGRRRIYTYPPELAVKVAERMREHRLKVLWLPAAAFSP